VTTLKEFEDALREQGMTMALAILEKLRQRDRANRTIRPARRIAGKKMTPELARRIIELNQTTDMTQQEIAFQLGVNQGRVNEVLKRGKWLQDNPTSEEAISRDRAKARMKRATEGGGPARQPKAVASPGKLPSPPKQRTGGSAQLSIEDFLNATSG
jgi:anaerobic glycerol-3-phosphate dehydrogenase